MYATGISGQFPSEYVTAVVSGQALGGVFTAIIEIMTITFASDARGSALIFFTIGNILLVLSVVAYILMTRAVFFRYYTSEKSVQKTNFSRLQRQPSIREPIFREVLNKIWLYGFTEWLVSKRKRKKPKISYNCIISKKNLFLNREIGLCGNIVRISIGYR